MLVYAFSLGACCTAVAYLYVLKRPYSWRHLVLKPSAMFFIILLAATKLPAAGVYGWLVLIALLFSVVGDVFLVLPSNHFLQGLIAFFIAHIFYVIAFPAPWRLDALDPPALLSTIALVALAASYYALLAPGANKEGGRGLQFAVILYIAVISLMVWRAVLSGNPLIIVGSLLFYVSDALLAWNRFVKSVSWGDYGVMVTYYSAQYLFTLSL